MILFFLSEHRFFLKIQVLTQFCHQLKKANNLTLVETKDFRTNSLC